MADILIPIAVSSQLDVTGEERIHAAKYSPVVRPTYVAPEVIWMGYVQNDNSAYGGNYRIGFAKIQDGVTTNIAWKQWQCFGDYGSGYNQTPFLLGNTLIGQIENDIVHTAPGTPINGIVALKYDGTQTLNELHRWQLNNTQYNLYHTVIPWGPSMVVVAVSDGTSPYNSYVKVLSYSDAVGFTELSSVTFPTIYRPKVTKHNDYLIVYDHSSNSHVIWTYTISAGVLNFEATGTLYPAGGSMDYLHSEGDRVRTQSGYFFTYNGGAIPTAVYGGQAPLAYLPPNDVVPVKQYFRYQGNNTVVVMHDVAGTLTTMDTLVIPVGMYGYLPYFMTGGGNKLLIPNTDANSNSSMANGVVTWNGTDLVRESPLIVPNVTGNRDYYTVPSILPNGMTAE